MLEKLVVMVEEPSMEAALEQLLQQPWDVVQLEHSYMFEPCRRPLQHYPRGFLLSRKNGFRHSSRLFCRLC